MSTISSPATIEVIQARLIRYFSIVLLIFGIFGNTLNIFIFTSRKLRLIPCSWYFLASTCSSLITLYMGCLTRILTSFDYYPQTTLGTLIYCKIRTYLTYADLSLSIWFIIGACADRWASSCRSVRIRSFSSVKIAKRAIIGLTLIIHLVYSQMFYCFDGKFRSSTSICQTTSETCELYNDVALFFTYSLVPASIMLIFGLLTIRNIQQTRQRVAASVMTIPYIQNTRRTTKQMTFMLLVQVICSIILSLPISIQKIYTVLSEHQIKSIEQKQLENFLNVLVILITLMNSSLSFYIFTLTGQIFRNELKRIFFSKFMANYVIPMTRQITNHLNINGMLTSTSFNLIIFVCVLSPFI